MTLPNYLQSTKNGWFRYRRAIPSDVLGHFKKKIYIECLHTRDLEEAKRQSHAISVKFNEHIERARLSFANRSERMLRSADIDHVSARFEAMLLYSATSKEVTCAAHSLARAGYIPQTGQRASFGVFRGASKSMPQLGSNDGVGATM